MRVDWLLHRGKEAAIFELRQCYKQWMEPQMTDALKIAMIVTDRMADVPDYVRNHTFDILASGLERVSPAILAEYLRDLSEDE